MMSTGLRTPSRGRSVTATRTIRAVAMTNGTLMAKIQRQLATSISQPPTSGPMTNAIPPHAVHEPIAPPRSSGGKAAMMMASALGVSSAPKTPWSARAAMSTSIVGAIAQTMLTTPKPTTPIVKTRRSPKRSPSEPPMRISDPSVSMYALETHCWPAKPPPRSLSMAGNATLTTVASRPATNVPRIAASKVRRLRRSLTSPCYGSAPCAPAVAAVRWTAA
jgi:hypothetical protein